MFELVPREKASDSSETDEETEAEVKANAEAPGREDEADNEDERITGKGTATEQAMRTAPKMHKNIEFEGNGKVETSPSDLD